MKRILVLILTLIVLFTLNACSKPAALDNASEDPLVQEILSAAEKRRQDILNSETAIVKSDTYVMGETYTGTAYYISNSGDDGNDGKSPETAWATLDQVNQADLQYGDAIFFQRGGIWRNTTVETRPGVTYSAYGEGAKPRICASPENGGGAERWSLWWEGGKGEKIWLYHRDMPDCGAIVLNEETVTQKILGFWDGHQYLSYIGSNNQNYDGFSTEEQMAQPVFDVKEQLSADLTFFSQADSELPDTLPIFLTGWNADESCYAQTSVGPLYFRCDEGNPGELFSNIEFQTHTPLFDGVAADCTLDNLFVGFSGDGCINATEGENVVVQNCEVGWVGGIVGSYNTEDAITGYGPGIQRLAGALGSRSNGSKIRNNYVHDMYHAGGGIEIFQEQNDELQCTTDISFIGNLFYHCASGVTFFNWDKEPNPEHQFKNCTYEDNYVMFTGTEPWMDTGYAPAFVHEGGPNMQEGCSIRNNVFFVARTALVYVEQYDPTYFPEFSGNTYIQYKDYPFILCDSREEPEVFSIETAQSFLQDNEGTFISLSKLPDGL